MPANVIASGVLKQEQSHGYTIDAGEGMISTLSLQPVMPANVSASEVLKQAGTTTYKGYKGKRPQSRH
eukprot:1160429-Pelagomonas_calceolata.AAC.16